MPGTAHQARFPLEPSPWYALLPLRVAKAPAALAIQVQLGATVVRSPAHRQRCWPARWGKGIRFRREEPRDEPVAVGVVTRVDVPFTPRAVLVRLNDKDEINALLLVEGRVLRSLRSWSSRPAVQFRPVVGSHSAFPAARWLSSQPRLTNWS